MSQITIYLDPETEACVNAAVCGSGSSKSKWIAEAIRARARSEWPASIVALEGAWKHFPSLEEIRKAEGRDRRRERL